MKNSTFTEFQFDKLEVCCNYKVLSCCTKAEFVMLWKIQNFELCKIVPNILLVGVLNLK